MDEVDVIDLLIYMKDLLPREGINWNFLPALSRLPLDAWNVKPLLCSIGSRLNSYGQICNDKCITRGLIV